MRLLAHKCVAGMVMHSTTTFSLSLPLSSNSSLLPSSQAPQLPAHSSLPLVSLLRQTSNHSDPMEDTFDPSLVEESSSSSSATLAKDPDHGWQKVTYAKRQRRLQHAANPNRHHPNGLPLVNDSSNVFATVEQKVQEHRRALEAIAATMTEATAAAPKPKSASGASNEEDNDSDAEAHPEGQENGEVAKKVKKKKPKKPKVMVQEAAAKVDTADLGAFLVEVSDSYESQHDIQLMRFADYFV